MEVKLGPFDGGLMGFSGLVPSAWMQAANVPGFYTPNGSATNSTQLLLQGAPGCGRPVSFPDENPA